MVGTIEKHMKLCIRLEDVYMEVSKSDWKLFRARIAEWQKLFYMHVDFDKQSANQSAKVALWRNWLLFRS